MKTLLICLFCTVATGIWSQNSNQLKYDIKQVTPPSPNASALGKYGEIPVSSNTGIPAISIPLYEIQAQNFNVPLSLSYHHVGFKPSEVSSPIGLGWSLNAGGVITRKVNGFPDEFPNGFYTQVTHYENNVKDRTCGGLSLSGAACQWRFKAINGEIDLEPDEFFFNFNGHSGRIRINQNRQAVCFPEQNFNISLDSDYNTWTITDTNGVRYVFDSRENSTFRYGGNYTSSWYLSQIINPRGTEVVTFEYATNATRWVEPSSTIERQLVVQARAGYQKDCVTPVPAMTQTEEQSTTTLRLTKIRFPKKSLEVSLSYVNDRKDVITGMHQRLQTITVTSHNTTIRNYTLDNNLYFGEAASADYMVKRLKLSAIEETLSSAKHQFRYTETTTLPRYTSAAIDHWGFYNGTNNSELIPAMDSKYLTTHTNSTRYNANREANTSYANTCMLNRITYPTKGYTSFTWEPNVVSISTNRNVYKSQSSSCNGGTFSMTAHESGLASALQFNRPDDSAMPVNVQVTPFALKAYTSLQASVSKWANAPGYCNAYIYKVSDLPEVPHFYLTPADLFSSPNSTNLQNSSNISLYPGGYLLITVVSRNARPQMSITAGISYTEQEFSTLDKQGGGLRIAKIQSYDGLGNSPDVVKSYSYKKNYLDTQSTASSAKLFINPYEGNYNNYAYLNQCSYDLIRTSYLVDYFGDLPRNTGYHIGYDEVTEIIGANGSGGFTITTFRNEEDPNSRELVVSKKSYDNASRPVHSIENSYITSAFMQLQTKVANIKLTAMEVITSGTMVIYTPHFSETLGTFTNNSWFGISQQKEKTYDNNNAIEITTHYHYDGLLNSTRKHIFPTRKTSTNSNGILRTEKTRYSFDFATPNTWLTALKNNNMVLPVEQQVLSGSQITSALYTQYNTVGEPTAVYRCNLSATNHAAGIDDSGNLTANTYYIKNADMVWNTSGALLTETINEVQSTTYLWGQNNTLPIVKIEGLKDNEIPDAIKTSIANYSFPAQATDAEVKAQATSIRNILAGINTGKTYLATVYTYKPNIGLTSVSHPNGATTYYNYDSSGRLKEIFTYEGERKEILQSFSYNYRNY